MKKLWEKIVLQARGLSRRTLLLQLLAGGYLFYLGWQILDLLHDDGGNPLFKGSVAALFLLIGAFLFLRSAIEITRNRYLDLAILSLPSGDPSSPPIVLKPYEEKMIRFFRIDLDELLAQRRAELAAAEAEADDSDTEEEALPEEYRDWRDCF